MNIGEPQRIIEVEPVSPPVPGPLPEPGPLPDPRPLHDPEPLREPGWVEPEPAEPL